MLDPAAGEGLSDHQVHERAWPVVIDAEIQVEASEGERASPGVGLLLEFAAGERPEVLASADARLLLLTPWCRSAPRTADHARSYPKDVRTAPNSLFDRCDGEGLAAAPATGYTQHLLTARGANVMA